MKLKVSYKAHSVSRQDTHFYFRIKRLVDAPLGYQLLLGRPPFIVFILFSVQMPFPLWAQMVRRCRYCDAPPSLRVVETAGRARDLVKLDF